MFGNTFVSPGGNAGRWTPVISTTVNVNYVTPFLFNYIKVQNQIMFNGLVIINSLAVGATTFYMSLPETPALFTNTADANSNGTSPIYGMIGSGQPQIGGVLIFQYFYSPIALTDMYTRIVGGYRL